MGENIPEDLVADAITEAYGERCPDFDPECFCCKTWAQYDALRAAPAEERERCAKIAEERAPDFISSPNNEVDHGQNWARVTAKHIATAIRSGVEDGRG